MPHLPLALTLALALASPPARFTGAPPAPAQAAAAAEPHDVSALLESLRAAHDVPALAAAVTDGERLLALGACGVRERGGDVAVTVDDRFHLGSCTKAMTATLVAQAVREGELAWTTTLGEVFGELEGLDAGWRGATLEQLLAHTSGAPSGLAAYPGLGLAVSIGDVPPAELRLRLVRGLLTRPPPAPPGSVHLYSNEGYLLATAVLEARLGGTWEERIAARLFEPLGMASAGFGPPNAEGALDHPRGHTAKGRPVPGADNPPVYGPAGRVHATLADWARFVRAHLRGAQGEDLIGLRAEDFASLHRARPVADPYALGWVVAERPWSEGPVLTHAGSNTLWYAVAWLAPAEGVAYLAVCNQGGDAGARATDAAVAALLQAHRAQAARDAEEPVTAPR